MTYFVSWDLDRVEKLHRNTIRGAGGSEGCNVIIELNCFMRSCFTATDLLIVKLGKDNLHFGSVLMGLTSLKSRLPHACFLALPIVLPLRVYIDEISLACMI